MRWSDESVTEIENTLAEALATQSSTGAPSPGGGQALDIHALHFVAEKLLVPVLTSFLSGAAMEIFKRRLSTGSKKKSKNELAEALSEQPLDVETEISGTVLQELEDELTPLGYSVQQILVVRERVKERITRLQALSTKAK
jgi:hypothetical protein